MTEPKPTYETASNKGATMNEKCEHKTTSILGYHGNVSLEVCDWGCGAVLVTVTGDGGISCTFTAGELLAIGKQQLERETVVSQEAS